MPPVDFVGRSSIFAGDDINRSLPGGPIFGIHAGPVNLQRRYTCHPEYGAAVNAGAGKSDIAYRKNASPAADNLPKRHFEPF